MGVIRMSEYKPEPGKYDESMNAHLGWLPTEFEVFAPNPKHSWKGRRRVEKDEWPIIVPKAAPPVGDLPQLIQNVLKRTWKTAEPSFFRGNITIGTRGGPAPELNDHFNSYVRPSKTVINTTFKNNDAIASDWKVFEQIKRTNAVAFRGDTRSPLEVIAKAKGFFPPLSRVDQSYYIENNIFHEFASYMLRRYGQVLTKDDFLNAVRITAVSEQDKKRLVDYLMWRKITEREAIHLGRMVENECLKGYISCSRAIDSSIGFGTKYNSQPGWLYLVVIYGGFVVPWNHKSLWGSEEAEIAQWGEVKAADIVGFTELDNYNPKGGPIFMRRSFRKAEPAAFEYMFNTMSGMTP
jgi:hypothetical protein